MKEDGLGFKSRVLPNTESNGLAICGGVRFEQSLVGLEFVNLS